MVSGMTLCIWRVTENNGDMETDQRLFLWNFCFFKFEEIPQKFKIEGFPNIFYPFPNIFS